jgi:hypothetical protein
MTPIQKAIQSLPKKQQLIIQDQIKANGGISPIDNAPSAKSDVGGISKAAAASTSSQESNLLPGIKQVGSSYLYQGKNGVKVYSDIETANKAAAKDLLKSGQSIVKLPDNNTVYKLDKSGDIKTFKIDELQSAAQNNKLDLDIQTAKNNDDYKTWADLQNQKYNQLLGKIKSADPITDQANVIAWQQQADSIKHTIETTKHFGNSFKRPKSVSLKINLPKITSRSRMRVSRAPSPKIKSTRVAMAKVKIKQPKR